MTDELHRQAGGETPPQPAGEDACATTAGLNALTDESLVTLARGVRLRADPLTGGPLLLYPEGFLPLDSSTHDILTRCDGELSFGQIILALSEEYEAEPGELRADVAECLTQLRQEMLVTW